MNDIFEIARNGLLSAKQTTSVIAHNIANADTPGYTREQVVLQPVGYHANGTSYGMGVNVADVQRMRNDLIDSQIRQKEQELGSLSTKSTIYNQIQSLFVTDSGSDLDTNIGDLFNSFSTLSTNPQDNTLRNAVISSAQTLVNKFHSLSNGLEKTSQATIKDAHDVVTRVNTLLKDLAAINGSISRSHADGKTDNNSKDLQVQKLDELSKLVNFDTSTDNNGALEIRIGGMLVLSGNQASSIKTETALPNGQMKLRMDNGKLLDVKGGQLAADIEMVNKTIPDLSNGLDQIASALVQQVNTVHKSGYGLADNVSRNFFDPSKTTAATIQLNSDILNNPENIAASSAQGEAGNGDNATKLVALRDAPVLNGKSLLEGAIQLISKPGTELSSVQSEAKTKDSVRQMLANQQDSIAGVNVDEELSNLIKFQNAYQASAKVLNVGQQMYDTLLKMV